MSARGWIRHAANAVTALRIALTPLFVWSVWRAAHGDSGWMAAALYALIAASDILDGLVARRCHSAGEWGRLLDHGADITFILASLSLYSWLGSAPWWVPAAIAVSFCVYVGDSWWRARDGSTPHLIGSWVGHVAGVLNYILVGILVGNETVGLKLLPPAVMAGLFWLVPVYSGAVIVTRLNGLPGCEDRRL